ncbi:hypothetical protein niasHS_002553 [Heterodera schachtii]|uniref:G-protein coupled receptors family 1 profile domain-containing protein n=1 Tax=Heterodera schachtii TaxID=97005 RepID=A0ABD2KKA1_HETSC
MNSKNGNEWANGGTDEQRGEPFIRQNWQSELDQQQQTTAEPFQRSAHTDAKMAAVLFCDVLGALCILLNAFVILALLRNRRRVLINVFYVLVLHCAVVDLIRGGCLIAWGMPHLLIHTMRSIDARLNALKINQFTLVILRSCNMLTIFNLLVFTTNEFIVIKYPLHYRRYFCRRTVVLILAICWLVSLLFGIGSVFANLFASSHLVLVLMNRTVSLDQQNDKMTEEGEGAAEGDDDGIPRRMDPSGVQRRQVAGLSVNVLCMLMIFVLCYVCLFTVLICYGKILRTIRQFQRHGGDGQRRTLAISVGSKKNQSKGVDRSGSVHQQRISNYQHHYHNQQQQPGESKREEKRTEAGREGSRKESQWKKVSVPGTPQSQNSQQTNCGRCANCTTNSGAEFGKSRRCNSHRKWRTHLMSRHKYLIVIGTVLFVDILFLFPYSGIQMVALLHLNNLLATSQMTTLIRWCLQILIGVHSVCQPLCYFRMTEFRRLACCLGQKRRFVGSGSSAGGSVFGGATAGTISRTTKGNRNGGIDEPQPTTKRSIVLRTVFSQGMARTEEIETMGERTERREESADWTIPAVDGPQMLLITQRRRWTRNLSLLCKEEGEELEMFLAREYRKRTTEKYGRKESEGEESGSEEKQTVAGEGERCWMRGGGSLREGRVRRKKWERTEEEERPGKATRK